MKLKPLPLFLLFFIPVLLKAQNLILNADAETLPLTNAWTIVSGNWSNNASGGPAAEHGSGYFFAGQDASAELYQDIDVSTYASTIDAGRQQFAYSGYIRTYPQSPSDQSREIVEYRDTGGVVLFSYDSQYLQNTTNWQLITDTSRAPKGTRIIRIRLLSKRNAGSDNDGYHDNLSLTALPVPAFSIANKSLKEGNTGTRTMKFIVTLKNPSNDTCMVKYNTADSTATAGLDYVRKAGTLIFPPYVTKDSFLITITGDKEVEPDEIFLVKLHNPLNAKINKSEATGTIVNDDTASLSNTAVITASQTNDKAKKLAMVWPNPVTNILNVQVTDVLERNILIQLISNDGQIMREVNVTSATTQHLNVSDIANGIYIVSVKYYDGKVENYKIIVQH